MDLYGLIVAVNPIAFARWFVPIAMFIQFAIVAILLKPEKEILKNSLIAGFLLSIFNFIFETANILTSLASGVPTMGGYVGGFTLLWTGLESFPVFTFSGAMFCVIMDKLTKRRYSVAYIVLFFLGFSAWGTLGDHNAARAGNVLPIPDTPQVHYGIWVLWLGFFVILDMFFWILNTRSKRKELWSSPTDLNSRN